MGMCPSKDDTLTYPCELQYCCEMEFMEKMRVLQQEIGMVLQQRDEERKVYEKQVMGFRRREAKWKEERKKLREEVKRLRGCLKESSTDGRAGISTGTADQVEGAAMGSENKDHVLLWEGNGNGIVVSSSSFSLLVEQMKEERARRDEAVEKWKMLYLDIKNELDHLIDSTHQGGPICWREEEEDLMQELNRELKAKNEQIHALKAQIAAMEQEEYKRKREFDILRQSLRIITSKKAAAMS
ncbi:hypothetical protein Dimus_001718 [Dionaea muscipula]